MIDPATFSNARIVLPERIVDGWLHMSDGVIVEYGEDKAPAGATDFNGDLLIPGLIELHTDHLEQHLKPRPKVDWPEFSAILAFDAQVAAAGITTVFDCVRAGRDEDYLRFDSDVTGIISTIRRAEAEGLLRAQHLLHLRCEICAGDVLDEVTKVVSSQRVSLMSLMDHTPGARQFTKLEAWRTYYGGKSGLSDAELDRLIEIKRELFASNYSRHRQELVSLAKQNGIVLASHDDTTVEHVDESIGDQVSIAEFPTTVEAARLSHEAGIRVLMGAPNIVRGGSHSGNIAAESLARAGYLDALSSDYVPVSLLLAAFELVRLIDDYDLSRALRTVTLNPATAAGLVDRGEIAPGKRADLIRVSVTAGHPIVREVYREGRRVI
ncbi:MAG: hypothetical protein RLZ98_1996 [Pseudomonadota bacterium]